MVAFRLGMSQRHAGNQDGRRHAGKEGGTKPREGM
jgi:hypothetical protein